MFLLVSQHGVSIQISINLGKTFLRMPQIRNIPLTWILTRGLCIFTSFHFPDSGLNLLNGFDFYFELFWMAWHWKPAIPDSLLKRLLNPLFPLGYSEGRWGTFKRANVTSLNFIRLLRIFFSSQKRLNRPAVQSSDVTTTRKLGSDFDWLIF